MEIEKVGSFKIADDLALVQRIVSTLERHYPGYLWGVLFDEDGGVLHITNESIQTPLPTNEVYAYTLHLKRFSTDPDLRCVVRAGGELLERANLHRGWNRGESPKRVDGVPEKHQPVII